MNPLDLLYQEYIAEGFSPEEALVLVSKNGQYELPNPNVTGAAKKGIGAGLKKWYEGIQSGKPLINGKFTLPNIGKVAQTVRNAPIMEGGPSVAGLANTGMGLYQGGKALSNINQLASAGDGLRDIESDIKSSAFANPMYASYLDASQKKLLRQIQNGSYNADTNSNALSEGIGAGARAIPKALLSALGGYLMGGAPGAIINGVGTLANSGIQGATAAKNSKQSELQSLYETLNGAEQDYNAMRRPTNLNGAGLQRRYSNLLM